VTIPVSHLALHLLHVEHGNVLVDETGAPFDMEAYSRFKYGKKNTGRHYGVELVRAFVAAYPAIALSNEKVVVSGPSYKYLSTASHGIVRSFCTALNAYRVKHGIEPVEELHSIRSTVGSDTYAMGDAALRATHLAKSKYHVDTEMVRDSHFIFIDDVNVTGATQERTIDRTIPCEPLDITCLHVAVIDPDYAASHAAIENTMNKSVSLSLGYIAELIGQDDFRLNTRVFRSIMEWQNLDELSKFFAELPASWLLTMHDALVSGTVEMYSRFPKATALLETTLTLRGMSMEVGYDNSH
jgi:hypothetical protein